MSEVTPAAHIPDLGKMVEPMTEEEWTALAEHCCRDGDFITEMPSHEDVYRLLATIQSLSERNAELEEKLIKLPEKITFEIGEILGVPNFRTGPLAHLFREAGEKIPTKMEREQSYILFKLLKCHETHGGKWREEFQRQVQEARAALKKAETP